MGFWSHFQKLFAKPKTIADFPLSPSKCFLVSYFRLRSINPFKVNFYMQHDVYVKIISIYEYPFVSASFVEKAVPSPLIAFAPLPNNQLTIFVLVYFWTSFLFHWSKCLSCLQSHTILITAPWCWYKSWIYIVQVHRFCCSFSIVLTTLVPLIFGINVRISYWSIF